MNTPGPPRFHDADGKFWNWLYRFWDLCNPQTGEATISSGSISINRNHVLVNTESSAASDDLDTIVIENSGTRIVLQAADSAKTVVCKDGTGNLALAGDFSLDNTEDTIELISNGTNWCELSRSDNGA